LQATVEAALGIRCSCGALSTVHFHPDMEGIARHGRPIQYSHITRLLTLCDVWTPIAGAPVAFEPLRRLCP
jgi:hypothetical protein